MTVQSTVRKAGPFLSGTSLPFDFKVFAKEDIQIIYTDSEGVESTLVLDSDYTVSLNADQDNNPGGTATLGTAISSGDNVVIIGDLDYDQGTDIRNQNGFEPEIIEDALDRATIQIQQLLELLQRTIKLPASAEDVNTQLPLPTPSMLIGFTSDGLGFQLYPLSSASVDSSGVVWAPPQRVFSIPNRSVKNGLDSGIFNIKWDSRFKQDRTTDNTQFIAEAIANAYAENCALYIPGAQPGFYASVEGGIDLAGRDNMMIRGDGIYSLLSNTNNTGGALITLNGAKHVRLKDFTLTGEAGAGSGIVFNGSAHHYIVEGVLGCWIDGDACFDIVEAISGRFIGCSVEENNGFDPGGLGGVVRGNTKRAWWVRSQVAGLNNDTNLVACKIDGAGAGGNYALQVGTPGGTVVESFKYQGLIQAAEKLVRFAAARDANIRDTHIEPPVGALADYVVRIEDSINCSIEGRNIQGDVLIKNSVNSGLKHLRCGGINIEPDCVDPFIRNVQYGNIVTGPIGGKLIDACLTSRITDTTNASNVRYAIGDSLKWNKKKYFGNNMSQQIVSGGVGVLPCGFEKFGSYTGSFNNLGATFSAGFFRIPHTGDFTQGFKLRLAPISQIRGRKVLVDAIVFNQLVAGGGYILLETTGGATPGTNGQESFQLNREERMQVSFSIPADASTADLIFTGANGAQVNWGNIDISVEGYTHITTEEASSAASATPDVSFNGGSGRGGYPLKVVLVGAGSNITDFTNPHTGKPFTVRFTAGRTVVNSLTLKLAGAVDFVATADDLLTLEYGSDGVFREVSRSVN